MRSRWGCLPTIELQGGGAKKSDRRPPDVVQWTAGQKGNTYEYIKNCRFVDLGGETDFLMCTIVSANQILLRWLGGVPCLFGVGWLASCPRELASDRGLGCSVHGFNLLTLNPKP